VDKEVCFKIPRIFATLQKSDLKKGVGLNLCRSRFLNVLYRVPSTHFCNYILYKSLPVIEFHGLANFVGMVALARSSRFRKLFSFQGSCVSFDSLRRPIYRHQ
jgi:hypothetical protein